MEFHRGRLLDHVQLRVKNLEASKRYRAVLAALGQGENFVEGDGNNVEAVYHGPAKRSAESVVLTPTAS